MPFAYRLPAPIAYDSVSSGGGRRWGYAIYLYPGDPSTASQSSSENPLHFNAEKRAKADWRAGKGQGAFLSSLKGD